MTPQGQRLRRILHLRERMHDVASLDLRVAHGALQAAEDARLQVRHASGAARDRQGAATPRATSEDWLLACADAESYKLAEAAHTRRIATANLAVTTAAGREVNARRERRQMEVTLAAVRRKDAYDAARAEQKSLDESSRHLLAFSHPALQKFAKPV